jgi:hypothetical protein
MNLELLCLLVGKLRMATTNLSRRVNKQKVALYVFRSFRHGTGVDEMINECEKNTKSPLIVSVNSFNSNGQFSQYFIKFDKNLILIPDSFNFNNVIEIFFKLFYAFNIKYTPEASNLFCLFEYLCNIKKQTKIAVSDLMAIVSNS